MRGSLGFGIGIGLTRILNGGDGVVTTSIYNDSNIVITFSEAVQPATVTNVGDGTGSFELYNDTDAAWVAGVLSTSDNIQWTFNPTTDFTVGDRLTLYLKDTILTVVGSNPYEGPFEFNYRVVNRLPTMDTFTIDATSVDANIGILTATGTDLDGHTLTFGISLTNDSSTVTLWQNEAAWQGSGFDSGLPEGTDASIPLYCFARDSVGGISLVSISDTCAVDINVQIEPVIDLDASVTASMLQTIGGIPVENVNDPVREWLDQSPDGFDMTAELNGEPLYQPGIQNGLAGVVFGHELDIWMRNTSPLLTDDAFTMYIVQKAPLPSATQVIIAQHKLVSADAGRYQVGPNAGAASFAINRFFHEESGSGYSLDTTDTAFDSTAHIIMISGDGAGNFITSVDGGTEQSLASPSWTPLNAHTTIGAQVDPADLSNSANIFLGHLFQLRNYDYQRDTGTRASDISALITKWGIV